MWDCVIIHILLKEYFQRQFQIWSQKNPNKCVILADLVKQPLYIGVFLFWTGAIPVWPEGHHNIWLYISERTSEKKFTNFRATSSVLVVHFFNLITKINNGCKGEIQVSFSFNINESILAYINSGPCRQSSLQKYRRWATLWIKSPAGLRELQEFIHSGI